MEEVILPCCGRLASADEIASWAGVTVQTIIQRFRKGWRDERLMERRYGLFHREEVEMPETPGYTETELFELYKGFADSIEERQMLADFMGREPNDPEVIITLNSFRARRWR